jgi:predicted phosphohydrolase
MKIAIHSDLHLEGNRLPKGFAEDGDVPDVVILAGDIGVRDLEDDLGEIKSFYPNSKIIFVPGNHEYYSYDFDARNIEIREICNKLDIFFMLSGAGFIIDDVYIIGSTCWSDMSSIRGTPALIDKQIIQANINDFRLIKSASHRWTVDDMIWVSSVEKRTIEHLLINAKNNYSALKVVVVSHFPPLLELVNPIFPKDAFTSYFHNDWSDLILKYEPTAWIYGHTHYNSPVDKFGETRLLSNQFGYNKEPSNQTYKPNHLIEI